MQVLQSIDACMREAQRQQGITGGATGESYTSPWTEAQSVVARGVREGEGREQEGGESVAAIATHRL